MNFLVAGARAVVCDAFDSQGIKAALGFREAMG